MAGRPDLIVVVGPTASGKSALAVELCEALNGEIVNADSVQIYRHFDIGSGKPPPEEMARVPHHLIGVVDPLAPMDAGRFVNLADEAIQSIRARGKRPIVCGGTFMWAKALLHGLAPAPPADPAIRARHASEAEEQGRGALHARLQAVDPRSAERLAPNDFIRVSRALEVWELTGRTLSDWQDAHGFREARHEAKLIGVRWSSAALSQRISERTARFLRSGWVEEVRELRARGYADARAIASVGYLQVASHLDGELPEGELPLAIDRATRVFARRQRTWLRDQPVIWLEGPAVFAAPGRDAVFADLIESVR
jgi:tRNA dimethylallyltransferase